MVCALNVYAPVCISDKTFFIFAFAIASGRRPSKLTINTRLTFGAGVDVNVGRIVSVDGGREVLGIRVPVGGGTIVGVGEDPNPPQLVKNAARQIKPRNFLCKLK